MGSFANEMKNSISEPYTSSLRPHLSHFHPKDRMRLSGAGEAHGITISSQQVSKGDFILSYRCRRLKKFQSSHITSNRIHSHIEFLEHESESGSESEGQGK
jgi:hypothetical protein